MMDNTKIADWQHRLARRIQAFHSKDFLTLSQCHNNVDDNDSGIRMNPLNFHDENPLGEEDGDDVMELDDEYDNSDDEHGNMDEADEDPSNDEDEAQPPERMQLMMPSSVYRDDVVGLGLEALIAQELEL
jgi:hypothetical protein